MSIRNFDGFVPAALDRADRGQQPDGLDRRRARRQPARRRLCRPGHVREPAGNRDPLDAELQSRRRAAGRAGPRGDRDAGTGRARPSSPSSASAAAAPPSSSAPASRRATGEDLHQKLLDAARPNLMRIIGPNCLGLISTPQAINASFAHLTPKQGHIALVSQSGAIIAAMLGWAHERDIGFSHVVSLGDMSRCRFRRHARLSLHRPDDALDPALCRDHHPCAQIHVGGARRGARPSRSSSSRPGRSAAGARAAMSHTGALTGADAVYDAAFRRAGLLRVRELDELFAAAAILATGMRVARRPPDHHHQWRRRRRARGRCAGGPQARGRRR